MIEKNDSDPLHVPIPEPVSEKEGKLTERQEQLLGELQQKYAITRKEALVRLHRISNGES